MIKITFPDGSVREYNEGVNGLQIAESISSRLAQEVLACGVNGETYDLGRPINEDANFVLYKWDDEDFIFYMIYAFIPFATLLVHKAIEEDKEKENK